MCMQVRNHPSRQTSIYVNIAVNVKFMKFSASILESKLVTNFFNTQTDRQTFSQEQLNHVLDIRKRVNPSKTRNQICL